MGRRILKSGSEPPEFAASYPRAVAVLENAVHTLLSNGWEEPRRRQAHEMATALSQGAKAAGWKETGGVLQALGSLLSMPLEEVIPVRSALREKLLELLALLTESRSAESA